MPMQINAFIVGSGRAAQALTESLKILEIVDSEFRINSIRRVARGESLKGLAQGIENPVLIIANPHGLHAKLILEADKEGFALVVCEKPAAVSLDEIKLLHSVKVPVAICHGYRQSWGVQTLKKKIDAGEFGELISVEGRYWQSSAAQAALSDIKKQNWKNDTALGGTADTLIDIASHWLDAAMFLTERDTPKRSDVSLSYVNAEAPHRDTHVNLNLLTSKGIRLFASVSKTVHGAANHFEINVIGSKKYASWKFLEPDLIEEGVGSVRSFHSRRADEVVGSGHSPHHALGWLEGYVEIIKRAVSGLKTGEQNYPTLPEHLKALEVLLTS